MKYALEILNEAGVKMPATLEKIGTAFEFKLEDGTERDIIIVDLDAKAIAKLAITHPNADLRAVVPYPGKINNTPKGFMVIQSDDGETPVGAFDSDYNPGVQSLVIAFKTYELEGGINIYGQGELLGQIVSASFAE